MSDDLLATGRNVDDFIDALKLLDEKLGERDAGPMALRAVGGFALICHDLRKGRSTTLDIDTVTPTMAADQASAVIDTARELGFPEDWINDDTVLAMDGVTTQEDCDAMDAMIGARYLPAADVVDGFPKLENIDLEIADLPTLAHSKAFAMLAVGQGRTSKDALDFMDVARALDAPTLSLMHERMPWLDDPELDGFDAAMCDAIPSLDDETLDRAKSTNAMEHDDEPSDPYDIDDVYDDLGHIDDMDGLDAMTGYDDGYDDYPF